MTEHVKFVLSYLHNKSNGIFIDVGASDGITYSNTYDLEKLFNWTGICIEPHPNAFKNLIKNRSSINLNIAINMSEIDEEFWQIDGYSEMLSGFASNYDSRHKTRILQEVQDRNQNLTKIKVPIDKLSNILKNYNTVDYLSIDVEGSELNVLQTIDFTKTLINIISVEDNYNEKICENFLTSHNYQFALRIGLDDFYVKGNL